MKHIRFSVFVVAASVLGACASNTGQDTRASFNPNQDWEPAEVRALTQHGGAFSQALHKEYVGRAQVELDERHWNAVSYMNSKARQAAAGTTVLPTRMDERTIPDSHVAELTGARTKLIGLLRAGGASKAPTQTARTQLMFDCWMEEQEEDIQPDDIAFCRNGFHAALNDASNIVFAAAPAAAVPMQQAVAPSPPRLNPSASYIIYFDFDSSKLNGKAKLVAEKIVAHMRTTNATAIAYEGHTDRSGSREYNALLAERRAAAVAAEIKAHGINASVSSESFGEDHTAVTTADDVREWQNRRAIIRVQ